MDVLVDEELRGTLQAEIRSRAQLVALYGGELLESVEALRTRQKLRVFYAKHNPAKVDEVDAMLKKYEGKERKFIASLDAKYGSSPAAIGDGLWVHRLALRSRTLVALSAARAAGAQQCEVARREAKAKARARDSAAALAHRTRVDVAERDARAVDTAEHAARLATGDARERAARDVALAELRGAQRAQLRDTRELREMEARRAWTRAAVAYAEHQDADERASAAAAAEAVLVRADARAAAASAMCAGDEARAGLERALRAAAAEEEYALTAAAAVRSAAAYRAAAGRAVVAAVGAVAAAELAAERAARDGSRAAKDAR